MRARAAAVLVVLACALDAPPLAAEDPAALERALQRPPATGLLLLDVVRGSAAEAAGLEAGDVLVRYAGHAVATLEELAGAKTKAQAKDPGGEVEVVVHRGSDAPRTLRIRVGPLGVSAMAVEKGQAPSPLPESTEPHFELSPLASAPREDWARFSLDGTTYAGFEHGLTRLEDGRLVMRREVAFDGGETWGLNHFDVTVVLTTEPALEVASLVMEVPLASWRSEGRLERGDKLVWKQETRQGEEAPTTTRKDVPPGPPLIPGYAVEVLAGFLPREKGACFHFRPVTEGDGRVGLPAALFAVGPEEITLPGGKRVVTWRVEQRQLGGAVLGTYWLDAEGRTVRVDYRGAWGFASTKEQALEHVPEGVTPRTTSP